MTYRPDIDGLRAIAVILVILFHSKISSVPGGYVGVDVFFAISGFLITSIIYRKMQKKQFSFKDFYLRRARRLLPASMFMTLATVLTFATFYPPDLFKVVAESALSSLLFSSNLYFWQQSGYFSASLELQPLLHTWSLSVEEQFYFLFPLGLFILLLLKVNQAGLTLAVAAACILSLILAITYAPNQLSFIGFYVLPTRFYEMGLGALMAIALAHHPKFGARMKYLREIGMVCILFSVLTFDKHLTFPSYYALLPVIGSLLIIFDGNKSGFIYSLLTSRPAVFFGLISYSLYLWHWPIWVLFNWWFSTDDMVVKVGYYLLVFAVSILSYYIVERPLREPSFYKSLSRRYMAALFALVTFAAFTTLILFSNRPFLPLNEQQFEVYTKAQQKEPLRDECTDTKRLKGYYSICTIKAPENASYKILIWGDSHASALMSALVKFSDKFAIHAMNTSGCPSLMNIRRKRDSDCHLHNDYMKEYLEQNKEKYDLIINVSAWNNYTEFKLFETDTTQVDALHQGIAETIEFYADNEIRYMFFQQIPKQEFDVPLHYFRQQFGIIDPETSLKRHEFDKIEARFKDLFPNEKVFISLTDNLCNKSYCEWKLDNILLYQDNHHLSKEAGYLLAKNIEEKVLSFLTSH